MQKIIWLLSLQLSFITMLASAQNVYHKKAEDRFVKIETNFGEMIFLLSEETPNHTSNFIKLTKNGYFNTFNFNRIIKGFVIQGGETDSAYAAMERAGKMIKRIEPEFSPQLFHQKGALAAGRDDNKQQSSFTGQFYVVDGKKYTDLEIDKYEKRIGDNFHFSPLARKTYKEIGGTPSLDQKYTVFGQLIKGFKVLDSIAFAEKDKADKPFIFISIKVSMLSKKEIKLLLKDK